MSRNLKQRDERGGFTAVVTIFAMPIVALLITAAVELSCMYTTWCADRDDLTLAVEQVEQSWFDLQLKNSETPGEDLAEQVARALRENGFNGAVDVWVEERELSGEGMEHYRAIAFFATATDSYTPLIINMILDGPLEMAVTDCDYLLPYSSNIAWKPADEDACSGGWHVDAGQPASSVAPAAEEVPEAVSKQLSERLDAAEMRASAEAAGESWD